MNLDIRRLFADITTMLEDLHAVAIDGQRSDNTRDMHGILAGELRRGIAKIEHLLLLLPSSDGDGRH